MTAHTFSHARHLYRGKGRREGISPGTDKDSGTRGIKAYIPTKYVIAQASGTAVPASAVAALGSAGSASSIAITTTTLTGNSTVNGAYTFARVVRITTDDSADEAAVGTAIGLDMYGATIQSNFTLASASFVDTDKAFAVLHSLNVAQQSCTVKVGYSQKFGLPYHLNANEDGIALVNRASGAAGATATHKAVVLWEAGVTAAGTVTNSGGDARGLVAPGSADVVDGSAHLTVWFYVENTDIAYGPGVDQGGGGNA